MFLALEFLLLFTEVELLEAFNFIADLSEAAAVKGTSDTNDSANRNLEVYTKYVNGLVKRGLISVEAAENRLLLIKVMLEAGLYPYRREWWHYEELIPMSETRKNRKLLNF